MATKTHHDPRNIPDELKNKKIENGCKIHDGSNFLAGQKRVFLEKSMDDKGIVIYKNDLYHVVRYYTDEEVFWKILEKVQ